MIEQLENLPVGTLGFRAVGTVEPADYENVLVPAIDAVLDEHAKVNLVYVIGDDFDRYSLGAIWQDSKLAAKPHDSWGRIAFVTNHDWFSHAASLFSFLAPGELKVFELESIDDAVAWVGGS